MRRVTGMLVSALLVSHLSFLISSCSNIDCPVQNTVLTVYEFMKSDSTADTLIYDTLWVRAVRANGSDTLLMNSLYGSNAFRMKLHNSATQPEDVMLFVVKDTAGHVWRDSVRMQKENFPHFESVDCKASFFHKITGISCTHNIIDSIVVKNPNITYEASTNLLLYLKARH